MGQHEEPNIYMCDACDYTADSEAKLYGHAKYNHDDSLHICDLCSKEFKGDTRLKLHIRSSHREKKPCPYCGKFIWNLWKHIKTAHTSDSEKKYQCDECDKGFVDMYTMEGHKRNVHIRDRPFVCRYMCGIASNDKGNRKKHEIAKHGAAFEV